MIVTDQFAPMVGGVPATTRSLAEGLAGRGHDVTVVAPESGDRGEDAVIAGLTVHRCPSFEWPFYHGQRLALPPFSRLRRLVAAFDPDIVHIHSLLVLGTVARTAGIQARKRVIATHHYLPINTHPSLVAHPIPRAVLEAGLSAYMVRFYNRCDVVTAPTATGLSHLVAQGLRPPCTPVSNGVDLTRFYPGQTSDGVRRRFGLPTDVPLVLYLNRLSPEKRPGVLLEAAARLRQPGHVVMAGTGPLFDDLLTQTRYLKIQNRVTFLGHVPDDALVGLYRTADLFVIPSDAELQSLATMEAMACGLPVVAANAQALPELVHHGENGYLFPPGDRSVLASYLDALLDEPATRAQMGARGLEIVRRHDLKGVLTEWETLYQETLRGTFNDVLRS